jgi:hypothetical protein
MTTRRVIIFAVILVLLVLVLNLFLFAGTIHTGR